MKTSCSQIEDLVQQYLDRDLNEPEQRELLAHLQQCRVCQAGYGPLLDAIRDVEQAAAPQVPAGLLMRVLEELPAVQVGPATQVVPIRHHPGRLVVWFSGVAAAAAIVLMTVARLQTGVTPADRPLPGRNEVAVAELDPRAMMWLASAACTARIAGGESSAAMAAGQVAAWHYRQTDIEPVRVVVRMTTPTTHGDLSGALPASDVLELLASQAALRGGI